MAQIHFAAAGSNTAPYDTWAKASQTWALGVAAAAAGDELLFDSAFSSSVSSISSTLPGTPSNPNRILSVTHSGASGYDAITPGAVITTTSNAAFTVNGSFTLDGVDFITGSVSSAQSTFGANAGDVQRYRNCKHWATGGGNVAFSYGPGSAHTDGQIVLENPSFKFAHTGSRVVIGTIVAIEGGEWAASGTTPTGIFTMGQARGAQLRVSGFNFANLSSTVNIIQSYGTVATEADFVGCRMPASWSGSWNANPARGHIIRAVACGNASRSYDLHFNSFEGTVDHEATIVMTGGASDGTTPLSRKLSSRASNVVFPSVGLVAPLMAVWNSVVGSPITITVEYIADDNVSAGQGAGTGNLFRNDQVVLRALYFSSSSYPTMSWVSSQRVFPTAAADNASSSVTWTTTGLTTPRKEKVSVTLTAQRAGYVMVELALFTPSKTIYVNHGPVIT